MTPVEATPLWPSWSVLFFGGHLILNPRQCLLPLNLNTQTKHPLALRRKKCYGVYHSRMSICSFLHFMIYLLWSFCCSILAAPCRVTKKQKQGLKFEFPTSCSASRSEASSLVALHPSKGQINFHCLLHGSCPKCYGNWNQQKVWTKKTR